MLKFVTQPKADEPTRIGLGLSLDNLARLRTHSIQFHAADLGLGDGVFVIAHADDPQLPTLVSSGEAIHELLILTERTCQAMRGGEVLTIPLRAKDGARPREAILFAGETEEALLEAFRRHGWDVNPTYVVEVFRVGWLPLLKLGAGAAGFLVGAILVSRQHPDSVTEAVSGMLVVTAAVLGTMFWRRVRERVEIDASAIRCIRPWGAFEIPFRELDTVSSRRDALGPFELELRTDGGRTHKLQRIYGNWDTLCDMIVRGPGRSL